MLPKTATRVRDHTPAHLNFRTPRDHELLRALEELSAGRS